MIYWVTESRYKNDYLFDFFQLFVYRIMEYVTNLMSHEADEYDYESLPSSNVGTHMMAGAMAGMMEHVLMYPLDSVKVSSL